MLSNLETKRFEYKQLRSSLDKQSRDKWREKEIAYSKSNTHFLTPDQWLFELNKHVINSQFKKVYNAWHNNRKSNPHFWGENYCPFLNVEKYKLATSKVEKIPLLKQQLISDILLQDKFQNSQYDRD